MKNVKVFLFPSGTGVSPVLARPRGRGARAAGNRLIARSFEGHVMFIGNEGV